MEKIKKPVFRGVALVCDDNNMNVMVMCEHLKLIQLDVIVATNGSEAVKMVCDRAQKSGNDLKDAVAGHINKQFDIIFMDIHMPVMSGVEASLLINKIDSSIPIIAITTDNKFCEQLEFKDTGIVDYMGKPFTTQELWKILLKYLKPVS